MVCVENFFPTFKSNCLEHLNMILCLSPLSSGEQKESAQLYVLAPYCWVCNKKLFESEKKKSYILLELSQVLNGLDKQHKDRNTSLLPYKHCPCYKVFVHCLAKPWFWLHVSRCLVLMKDDVWRTSVYMQLASLSGSLSVNILNFWNPHLILSKTRKR